MVRSVDAITLGEVGQKQPNAPKTRAFGCYGIALVNRFLISGAFWNGLIPGFHFRGRKSKSIEWLWN